MIWINPSVQGRYLRLASIGPGRGGPNQIAEVEHDQWPDPGIGKILRLPITRADAEEHAKGERVTSIEIV